MSLTIASLLIAGMASASALESCGDHASPVKNAAQYIHRFDQFKLTYFDGRGLAEIPRTLFATVGRFPGEGFEDVRLDSEGFGGLKGTGDLAKNLNRLPVLNHNGAVIGQSKAISRYLAAEFGLLGTTGEEAAQIDAITEHVADIQAAYRKLFPYKNTMTDDEKAAAYEVWFETPSSPALDNRGERQLQWFLEQVENIIPDDGFCVGGRPSLADAFFFNLLGEHAPEAGKTGEPFGNLEGVTSVLSKFPKVNRVVTTFKSSPGMEHYLKTRGHMNW